MLQQHAARSASSFSLWVTEAHKYESASAGGFFLLKERISSVAKVLARRGCLIVGVFSVLLQSPYLTT